MQKIIEAIARNLPIGLLVMDGKGVIIEANPAACTILGCPLKGFLGNRWGDLFLIKEDNLEFSEVVFDAIQKETPTIERVTQYRMPDGQCKFLSVISSAHRNDGTIQAIVVLIEDLTELHELHEREKEILALNHQLATQRAESLDAFARSVAHQIRNPIMAIGGFAGLLKRTATPQARHSLDAISVEASKLETIVKSVSQFSAIAITAKTSINLWVIIEEARQIITRLPIAADKDISWNIDCPDMNIMGDKVLLVEAITATLTNSVEFGEKKTTITIRARDGAQSVMIEILDNGPGFTDEALQLGFDPFFTTKSVGVGMGLTRAKRIITEHLGTIHLSNRKEGGAAINFSLPKTTM